MGRWEADARGRLEQAALALYGERGYEQTTVAEPGPDVIMTEPHSFRHGQVLVTSLMTKPFRRFTVKAGSRNMTFTLL